MPTKKSQSTNQTATKNQNPKTYQTGDWRYKKRHRRKLPKETMNRQREHGKPRFKYTDTLMREQGAGGERGGRRTGEVIRGRHKGGGRKQ